MAKKAKRDKRGSGPGDRTEPAPRPSESLHAVSQKPFRVVGIGASAGGLEALEQFFSNLPPDTGMAFIIIQHLDPQGKSSMPEILTRFTKMPVRVAEDNLKVEPNSIYLLPPGKNMGIENEALFLREPDRVPGVRLPVDFFFHSLAREKGPEAFGIILSGTGTDGTLGIKAIKAELGTVFVQDPESARYDGMPSSAIDTGLADFIVKPDEMPQKLIRFVEHSMMNGDLAGEAVKEDQEPIQQIFAILRARTGHDFSRYKQTTLSRRLQRRMSVNQINKVSVYAQFLKQHEQEVRALLKDVLISVTNFFRDPEAFEALKLELKKLLAKKVKNSDFRVWVAGCATGEEAYSVAMIISECLSELDKHLQVQMYGTDIDLDALSTARTGVYPANVAADFSAERLKRFFVKENQDYRLSKEIRRMVVFAPHNFIKDPPFSRVDLVCCRNLLIYLEADVQKRMIPLLHYALRPEGILFLGPSETIGEATDLFDSVDKKWKIYRRREVMVPAERLRFPAAFSPALRESSGQALQQLPGVQIPELTEKIFLDQYAPTFAVIDGKNRLVYVRGRTGKFLEIASGQPSLSVLEMAREGLRTDLASAIYRAASQQKPVMIEGLRVKTNGTFQTINLTVAPLREPGLPPGLLMLVFQEIGVPADLAKSRLPRRREKLAGLEEELKFTKESLQSTIEELEATNEELKAANEELQSNNEELQSTNEELDTSREEMQSLNEELTTVNVELRDKIEQLTRADNDLKNFLNRTDIAILFLDEDLNIRSYTPATSDVFNIRDRDVGRPLEDITSRLSYHGTVADAREVFRTLSPREVEVQRKDGCWYKMRILPYRTAENAVSGVVLSFLDINEQKQSVASLKQRTAELESANRELEDFSYTISHDLRAPLRSMESFSEAVASDYGSRLDEEGKDYLNRIKKASQTMSRLIDDLLKLSHIYRLEMLPEEVNLSDLAASTVEELKMSEPGRQVEFRISPKITARGDRQLLKTLIKNLLENSWKFTGKNPQARIDFGVVNKDGKPAYFIKDNGVGFNMKYADKLFQPFQRLHSDKRFPGNGIGLASVQRIVSRHGGKVWAEGEVGKGATFYFTLDSKDKAVDAPQPAISS